MRTTLLLVLFLAAFAPLAAAQESRERADRGAKAALDDPAMSEEDRMRAYRITQGFLSEQARAIVNRAGARTDHEIQALLDEELVERLDTYGIPMDVQRELRAAAAERLTDLAAMAQRREQGEASLKEALNGSSLVEAELHPALIELIEKARTVGPSLLRRAEEVAAEANAGALPGQEVEPDPIPLVAEYLATGFEGRGLTSGELEDLAVPFTRLITALGELDDAERFARR